MTTRIGWANDTKTRPSEARGGWCRPLFRIPPLRLAHRLRAFFAVVSFLLLGAQAAQAQVIPVKLVGNIGEETGAFSFNKDLTTAFTTGSHSDGYTLSQVSMLLSHEAGFGLPIYEVGIHADSSGIPGTRVGALSTPTTLPATFQSVFFLPIDDINLAANTTYWLVIDVQLGGRRTQVRSTTSPLEDGRPGWSIANHNRWRVFNSGGAWETFRAALAIDVWGSLEDTIAPTLVAGTINAEAVKLYFSETLDTFATLNTNQFTVTGNPTDLGAVASADFDGTERNVISLTTTNAATNSDTVTVTVPTTTGITDVAGNALAAITTAFSLTNTGSGAPGKPTLSSASVDGSALTLTYNQKLLPSFPAPEAFTVSATNTSTSALDFAINPGTTSSTVVLSLSRAVKADDTVTLSYNSLFAPPLQNHWGEEVDALSNHRVANDTDPPVASIEGDGIIDEGEDAEFTVILKPAPAGQVTVSLTITETGGFVETGDVGTKTVAVTNTGAATYSVPTKVLDRAMPMNGTVTATVANGTGYTVHDTQNADTVTVTDLATLPTPAEVTAVAISSTPSLDVDDDGTPETYGPNEKIQVQLTFSEAVTVTGTPRLKIKMDPDYGEIWADYETGSGTTNLVFAHTVVSPNLSTRGVAVLENTLALNGGTIRAGGTDAELGHSGLPHDDGHKVN
ncbi:MAG: hypothetical protein F4X98_04930, partial [Gammaproteobacteria bacterium]|nr:hypothetical protein [Gammaproteobacteria bacterium]